MGSHRQAGRSELFLVRVWAVDVGTDSGEVEWHGKVQRATDGEVHYWSRWPELMEWLLVMCTKKEAR